ncbi:ARF GTPase-like protein activator [Dothidotthia symphoricarpi CBS 119687]|uniref:ADP-ribosylation factor GTPase-activating protein n=1 Tax=Dothidotthia symphoricarpi CBS 119687 TaxID=1392245 RepID=A0A6A6ATD4_9PLEO|nr:ARF GTPase-like protein activator [Dothidotthia symphoricarpi CBS 119687]KAF2134117.1 ARF GTPase-like protein activator [Dothidotthia symphoricarpi CBS 119687]
MGAVNSKAGDASGLFLRDQTRFSVASLNITNSRNRTLLTIAPNAFPATRYSAKRELGDDSVIEYIQDPESPASADAPPAFLLRLPNDEELSFNFTFILRQHLAVPSIYNTNSAPAAAQSGLIDTVVNGLTFVFASSSRELDNLVTREFHANPNLHKNPQVELVGDYSTGGSSSVQFHWSWKWSPPKTNEGRGGGWRTSCSFVEYDQRAHKLDTLANFAFWVQNTSRPVHSPKSPIPRLELCVPPRLRVPSAQSVSSRVSDSADDDKDWDAVPPRSPIFDAIPEHNLGLVPSQATTFTSNYTPVKLDVSRPGEDLSHSDDGPLFRATMKSLEQKTGNMRMRWKKVLKRAEAAMEAQVQCNNSMKDLMDALKEASSSNANAVQPAIDHYFDKIAKEILTYERSNTTNIQKLIIDPIHKLYTIDIKQAETKRKDFEEESKDYYQYLGKYLGQRQDSLKEKKRVETDSKYQTKRRNFELKRFDYSSFMQDLHGGRKDQEVLSALTRYADAQANNYLETAKKIERMLPQLDLLSLEVKEADKEYQLQRTEREEKRRVLEKAKKTFDESSSQQTALTTTINGVLPRLPSSSDAEIPRRKGSIAPIFHSTVSPPQTMASMNSSTVTSPISPEMNRASLPLMSQQLDKFKGIRDLEEKNYALPVEEGSGAHRKEGLLWALSRPGSHVDPKGLNKQAWHKFWIVLDQGKLSEYTNWKQSLELHMDPIDLRMASVREARNAERRFCFEVITPHFTRVYQATNEDDLRCWISAVNNALQTAVESAGKTSRPSTDSLPGQTRRDIASVLTGKSPSLSSHRNTYTPKTPARHATVGDRPGYRREESTGDEGKLLKLIRDVDAGNKVCADCGTESKVDWVSINLGIVICIECSGIHRSLGTHITKVRSLTLDVTSFTPDIVEIFLKIGNRVSNMIWEARLDFTLKPGPMSTREQRLRFITSKYADRAYVAPISPVVSHYGTSEETLLASVKKNDIQNVLYALALRANPNARDRSRGTHVVFLALAAADPASPSASASPAVSPAPGAARPVTPQPTRKPFPVAELLLQNGAELPLQPAPIPLSLAARAYLDFKADQRAGKRITPIVASQPDPNIDKLPSLPSIMAGNGSSPAERARERDARLQKRVSASGRLVKNPATDPYEGKRGF